MKIRKPFYILLFFFLYKNSLIYAKNEKITSISIYDRSGKTNNFYSIGMYENKNIEAGAGYYKKKVFIFGSLVIQKKGSFLLAGMYSKSYYHPLVLSNGSYSGEDFSFPEKRPVGIAYQYGKNMFYLGIFGFYGFNNSFLEINRDNWIKEGMYYGIKYNKENISLYFENGIIKTSGPDDVYNSLAPFFALKTDNNDFHLGFFLAYPFAWWADFLWSARKFSIDFMFFILDSGKYKVPKLYEDLDGYRIQLKNNFFNLKLYHKKKKINIRSKLIYKFAGGYYYLKDTTNMAGIFLNLNQKKVMPYISFYSGTGFRDYSANIGLRLYGKWMISFFFARDYSRKSYPVDPAGVPDDLYTDGGLKDSFLYYTNDITGAFFFWVSDNYFIFISFFENYPGYHFENINAMICFRINKSF